MSSNEDEVNKQKTMIEEENAKKQRQGEINLANASVQPNPKVTVDTPKPEPDDKKKQEDVDLAGKDTAEKKKEPEKPSSGAERLSWEKVGSDMAGAELVGGTLKVLKGAYDMFKSEDKDQENPPLSERKQKVEKDAKKYTQENPEPEKGKAITPQANQEESEEAKLWNERQAKIYAAQHMDAASPIPGDEPDKKPGNKLK